MCETCDRMVQEVMDRLARGEKTDATLLFEEECAKRNLDPMVAPPEALRLISMINAMVSAVGAAVCDEPGLLSWYAASLAGMARMADLHAERIFEQQVRETFSDAGPTPPPESEG